MAGKVPAPPILSVAPLPTVRVPPATVRLAVKVAKSNVPPETFKLPAIAAVSAKVLVPAFAMVKLFKVCPALVKVFDEPFIVKVEEPCVTVIPVKSTLPPTETLAVPIRIALPVVTEPFRIIEPVKA